MTDAREAARTLLLLRCAKEVITKEEEKQKTAAEPLFDEGDKKTGVWTEGGQKVTLGKVEMRKQPPRVEVTDRAALLRWATEKRPALLEPRDDLGPLTAAITVGQETPDDLTPEQFQLVLSAAYRHLGRLIREQSGPPRLYPAAEAALLKNIGENRGVWIDGATGEAETIPGVTYEEVPPKLVVTSDKVEAPELVRSLLTTGMPPIPAIEAGPGEEPKA